MTEQAHDLLGVHGRLGQIAKTETLWTAQKWMGERRVLNEDRDTIRAEIRFDDSCNNGRNTFAITGYIYDKRGRNIGGGCCHDDIEKAFPELAPLIKWHLVSSDGPMHYVSNVCYLAGDRDYSGLLKGEKRQIRNGRTGAPCWELVAVNADGVGISTTETGLKYQGAETVPLSILTKNAEGDAPPLATPQLRWIPWFRIGEGKARELDAARHVAIWPDATDAELSVDRAELEAKLLARLPGLIADFRAAIESAGLLWEPGAA